MSNSPYEKVQEFHALFDTPKHLKPTAYEREQLVHRAGFKIEELVELLYATANNEQQVFQEMVAELHEKVEEAVAKIERKQESVADPLIGQVDALLDLLYFTYGSFVLMGVNPEPIFAIVHQANMKKLFPDGKPHYDPKTHKILKPADWEERYAPEPQIAAELERQKR